MNHEYTRALNPRDRPAWMCEGCGLDQPDHDRQQRALATMGLERDLAELDCIARRLADTHGLGAGLLVLQAARMLRRELAEGSA